MVIITIRNISFDVGYVEITKSLFYSIAHHLERRDWGSKYPVIMKELYYDGIEIEHLEQGLKEIKEIKEKLKEYAPEQIVWDYEDLTVTPPWGNNISQDIINLSNYFRTEDGVESIDNIIYTLEMAIRVNHGVVLEFENINERISLEEFLSTDFSKYNEQNEEDNVINTSVKKETIEEIAYKINELNKGGKTKIALDCSSQEITPENLETLIQKTNPNMGIYLIRSKK